MEKKLFNQIVRYRDGIINSAISGVNSLEQDKLDFPREDMSEYDKGYDDALTAIRGELNSMRINELD